jgi:DNA-nicking Smr family endonuclease
LKRREPPPAPPIDYKRGAEPLAERERRRRIPPPVPSNEGPLLGRGNEVVPSFELRREGTTIEGARVGFGRRVRELARGLLPVFETLDLHGFTLEKAEHAVRSFCANARGAVPRTVLIVHGKGLHSPAGQAVLRDEVVIWLSTPPVARDVLCFVTARPKHGGAGATYVLLAARPPSWDAAKHPRTKRAR